MGANYRGFTHRVGMSRAERRVITHVFLWIGTCFHPPGVRVFARRSVSLTAAGRVVQGSVLACNARARFFNFYNL